MGLATTEDAVIALLNANNNINLTSRELYKYVMPVYFSLAVYLWINIVHLSWSRNMWLNMITDEVKTDQEKPKDGIKIVNN